MNEGPPGNDGCDGRWTAVDRYFADQLRLGDEVLDAVLEASRAAGLPAYEVSPNQGKLLYLLAKLGNARRILEIGTLGGYSTIWMARAGAKVVTLEANPERARLARENVARAGLTQWVDVRLGPAQRTLRELIVEREADSSATFDVVFIDADKQSNPEYLESALALSHPGTLIIADNVVRGGAVVDATSEDPSVRGIRRFHERLAAEPRLTATAIQTVGSKGWDGFTLALVVT